MTFQDSLERRQRDIRVLQEYGIKEFQIENTSRCNYNCFMCDRSGPGKDMDDNLVNVVTGRFPAITEITLSGLGEPLSSPNIPKFVNEAKQHGHYVFIPTNAFYLNETLVTFLINTQVDQINISIDAATPSAFHEIHGVDAFEKVVSNAQLLVTLRNKVGGNKPKLSFCVVMSRRNVQQFPGLVRLASQIGIERVNFIGLTPCREEHLEQILYTFPGRKLPDELRQTRDSFVQEAKSIGDKTDVKVDISGLEFHEAQLENCVNKHGQRLYISADGDVSVCPILAAETPRLGHGVLTRPARYIFGNLKNSSFEEIVNSDSFVSYQSCVRAGAVPDFCVGCNWIHGL